MPSNTRFMNPSAIAKPGGYTHVVEVTGPARIVYIAGQLGLKPDGTIAGDFRAQATQAFANVRALVEAAGATVADVVMVRIYVVDYRHEHAAAVGGAFREAFAGVAPACSWIGVAALADPGFLIEVEAFAVFD